MNDYNSNYYQPDYSKKHSGLGIAAFILTILGCTSFIGLILAIVDLCVNRNRKHGFSIAAIIIFGVYMIFSIIGMNSIETNVEPNYSVSIENEEKTNSQEKLEENTINEEIATSEKIDYVTYSIDTLYEELNSNAMRAENKYQDAYIEVTGKISNFDSDGSYFSIKSTTKDYSFESIQCYYTNDEQKEILLDYNVDDVITIKAQITSIGEILGYCVDVIEISK